MEAGGSSSSASQQTHGLFHTAAAGGLQVLTRSVRTLQWLFAGMRQLLSREQHLQIQQQETGSCSGSAAARAGKATRNALGVMTQELRCNELNTWAGVVCSVVKDLEGLRLDMA